MKRTLIIGGSIVVGLTALGLIVGPQDEAPSEQPAPVEAETSRPPEPTPTPEPEPEPTPEPEPEPEVEQEPEPTEAPTPPNAEDDLARIVLDSVWRSSSTSDQADMCLLYNISPLSAWNAFSDSGNRTEIPQRIFDEHFTEVC